MTKSPSSLQILNMVAAFCHHILAIREGDVLREHDAEECKEEEEEQEDDETEGQLQVEVDDSESKELDQDITFMAFLKHLACFACLTDSCCSKV